MHPFFHSAFKCSLSRNDKCPVIKYSTFIFATRFSMSCRYSTTFVGINPLLHSQHRLAWSLLIHQVISRHKENVNLKGMFWDPNNKSTLNYPREDKVDFPCWILNIQVQLKSFVCEEVEAERGGGGVGFLVKGGRGKHTKPSASSSKTKKSWK